jgi:hypothetical protein
MLITDVKMIFSQPDKSVNGQTLVVVALAASDATVASGFC